MTNLLEYARKMNRERNIQKSSAEHNQDSLPLTREVVKYELKKSLADVRDNYYSSALKEGEAAKSAEGPMQSQHDTTKKEKSWLANAFADRGDVVNKLLRNWDELFDQEPQKEIGVGSIVLLEDRKHDKKEWFFLVPFNSGGLKIEVAGHTIRALNTNSVLGNHLIGQVKNQVVKYSLRDGEISQEFKVIEVI